jgi:hypothetical protein
MSMSLPGSSSFTFTKMAFTIDMTDTTRRTPASRMSLMLIHPIASIAYTTPPKKRTIVTTSSGIDA